MIDYERYICGDPIGEFTYVVTEPEARAAAVIDPGTINDKIRDRLKGFDLKYIILTHAHPDHIAALPEYRSEFPCAKLVMNSEDQDMLGDAGINHTDRIYGRKIEDKADIYTGDGDTMALGAAEMKFIHTPGHTKGGMCILIDGNLFSGDTLFRHTVGRTDLYGGDWETLKSSIRDKLFTLPDDIAVHPGHGYGTTIGEEKRANPFV